MCKTFDFCTLLWFLCSFRDRLLFRFQHWGVGGNGFLFLLDLLLFGSSILFSGSWIF